MVFSTNSANNYLSRLAGLIPTARAASRVFVSKHWLWLVLVLVFGLLLARDPFSTRTLIGNLEPYPDTFHYLVPPKCWLEGRGWRLCRPTTEGVKPDVPPLYSVTLLPVFLVSDDPRAFYLINVGLAVMGAWFFYDIVRRLTNHWLLTGIALGLYVTNFFTSWLPQLAMAENLLLPLFLANIWLLLVRWRRKMPLVAGVLAASLHGAKFVALPTMLVMLVAFVLKIWLEPSYDAQVSGAQTANTDALFRLKQRLIARLKPLALLSVSAAGVFLLLGGWKTVLSLGILQRLRSASVTPGASASSATPWYSPNYFGSNITHYWRSLRGLPARFLWDMTPIVPRWVAVTGWLGLGLAVVNSKHRLLAGTLIAAMLAQAGVIALYFTSDSRYILGAIPSLVIGAALFGWWLWRRSSNLAWKTVMVLVLGVVVVGYIWNHASRLRQQLAVNFKYAETPWWYVASRQLDETLRSQNTTQRPVVITAMAPYLLDFYGQGGYDLLPLYQLQDFRGHKPAVWGTQHDYQDLLALYEDLVADNQPVYVASYGLGNQPELKEAFAAVESRFELELIQTGCHDLCNVYRLSPAPHP